MNGKFVLSRKCLWRKLEETYINGKASHVYKMKTYYRQDDGSIHVDLRIWQGLCQIPAGFLADIDKSMVKFIQKCKALGMFKTILKKKNKARRSALPDFKTYCKVTVLETMVQTYGWKYRSMDWNGESRNKPSPLWSADLPQGSQGILTGKRVTVNRWCWTNEEPLAKAWSWVPTSHLSRSFIKMHHRPKYKTKNYTILRRRYRSKSLWPGLGNTFLNMTPKTQGTEENIRKL